MSLGNSLVALGQWFEKHFPEKLTAAEVFEKMGRVEDSAGAAGRRALNAEVLCAALAARVADLEKKAETFSSDINKTKVMLLTQRQTR